MPTIISNWKELSKLRPNAKYRIVMEPDGIGAWIRPIKEYHKQVKNEPWSKHSVYLNTHIFSGNNPEWATEMLHKFGFRDVEIENKNKKGGSKN